jgi:hypothetical protein
MHGQLGGWKWFEDRATDLDSKTVVHALAPHLLGLWAVCVSWDSGQLDPDAAGLKGWQVKNSQAVSPAIDSALVANWPRSSCGFDEWYFFHVVPRFERLHAICNWGDSLEGALDLGGVPSGFDLLAQLDTYQPHAVLGDARRVFVITRDEPLLAEFEQECGRRRTRR